MIKRVHARGITLLIVEHVMRAVMALSHRIVVLDQGNVVVEGEPAQVMADPAVIRAYLGDRGLDA
jgi:branched-chain amino acid transport system ATP-binding protein